MRCFPCNWDLFFVFVYRSGMICINLAQVTPTMGHPHKLVCEGTSKKIAFINSVNRVNVNEHKKCNWILY